MEFVGLNPQVETYLQRMNVYSAAGIEQCERFRRHDQRQALCEVHRLTGHDDADACAEQLARAVVGQIPDIDGDLPPDEMTGAAPGDLAVNVISYVLSEVLLNSLTHGRRNGHAHASAYTAAQYFPTRGLASLAVVDDGCGLLSTLGQHPRLEERDHAGAIRAALLPRVSCNPDVALGLENTANQGLGLTIIRDLVEAGTGMFCLASGDRALLLRSRFTIMRQIPHWDGTLLMAEFPRRHIDQLRIDQVLARYVEQGGMDLDLNFL